MLRLGSTKFIPARPGHVGGLTGERLTSEDEDKVPGGVLIGSIDTVGKFRPKGFC